MITWTLITTLSNYDVWTNLCDSVNLNTVQQCCHVWYWLWRRNGERSGWFLCQEVHHSFIKTRVSQAECWQWRDFPFAWVLMFKLVRQDWSCGWSFILGRHNQTWKNLIQTWCLSKLIHNLSNWINSPFIIVSPWVGVIRRSLSKIILGQFSQIFSCSTTARQGTIYHLSVESTTV